MSTTIVHSVRFESAHLLPQTPEGHRCRRLHGHSYRAEIHVSGPVDAQTGWIRDFADIESACAPVLEQLDHRYLNEVDGLQNPTAELIAAWMWQRLAGPLPGLSCIVLHETCESRCIYTGPAAD